MKDDDGTLMCISDDQIKHSNHLAKAAESRPKSFLRDEMDEFDRVFSELFFSPHKRMSHLASELVQEEPTDGTNVVSTSQNKSALQSIHEKEDTVCGDRDVKAGKTNKTEQLTRVVSDSSSSSHKKSGFSQETRPKSHTQATVSSPVSRRIKSSSAQRSSFHEDMLHSYDTNSGGVQEAPSDIYMASLRKLKNGPWDKSDKLFADLLDDLDSISKLDTESARKRKKARDLFSDWLFSHDDRTSSSQTPPDTGYFQRTPSGSRLRPHKSRAATKKRCSADLSELRTSWSEVMSTGGRCGDQNEVRFEPNNS